MAATIQKQNVGSAGSGDQGQKLLVSGEKIAMRLWEEDNNEEKRKPHACDYETVGYVIEGRAELEMGGETTTLTQGDSWLVPAGAEHCYHIVEKFIAVEATTPPAREH